VQYSCGTYFPERGEFRRVLDIFFGRIQLSEKLYHKNVLRLGWTVRHGGILRGVPMANNLVDGLFASHVLGHLLRNEFWLTPTIQRFG
jgi:hypothetical protein